MKKKIFLSLLTLLILAVSFFTYKIFGPAIHIKEKKTEYLFIKTGSSIDDVRKELIGKEFISSPGWFDKVADFFKYKTIKPGRYKMNAGMSLFELVRILRNGRQTPVNFVITKLRTKEDLARRGGNQFECDSLQLIQFFNNNDSLQSFGVDSSTVMALALPLTYTINWNTTPKKITQQLYNAWKEFWTEERKQKADTLGLTPLQVSTLASIIDEETNKASDRPNIASVYLNRLAKKMPLQADPTIRFALKDFTIKRVMSGHLQVQSPYNTYLNTGLPPGPICTPQAETIDAVLDAPKTDYLYFVANSSFDGTHIFTTNYDDHMKYAREYQSALSKLLDSAKSK